MTAEQIREIVIIVLDELEKRSQYKPNSYQSILNAMNKRLYQYFNGKSDKHLTQALNHLSEDEYIDVIYLAYRDEKTIEWIAEYYNREVSTIKRNKKRLILAIHEELKRKESYDN